MNNKIIKKIAWMAITIVLLSGCSATKESITETTAIIAQSQKETEGKPMATTAEVQKETEEKIMDTTKENQKETEENLVQITEKNDNRINEYIEVKIQYPIVEIVGNKDSEDKLNVLIQDKVTKIKASAAEIEEYAKDAKKQQLLQNPYYTAMAYKVTYNKNNVISITMEYSDYSGGAHGMYWEDTINFDILSGKNIPIYDLFKTDRKEEMVGLVNSQLKEYFAKLEGTIVPFETINENTKYKMTEDGIEIYFDLYEYTAYAFGIPRFIIKYEDFNENLNYDFIH